MTCWCSVKFEFPLSSTKTLLGEDGPTGRSVRDHHLRLCWQLDGALFLAQVRRGACGRAGAVPDPLAPVSVLRIAWDAILPPVCRVAPQAIRIPG